ncbi:mitochondrial 54S ribosomal protein YmL15 [Martiniozyma asiatica (nom. inval.)]|nr:mitochondrial 54S ribosomal protein YmL15 [Martiniozyma asiatica]
MPFVSRALQMQKNIITAKTFSRSLVYARGMRVQGLVRDPEEVLSTDGHKYGASEENLASLKGYLSQVSPNVKLSDDLLLQVLTHKSFAHGLKPYNATLSHLGTQLIQFSAGKKIAESGDISQLGTAIYRQLWSDKFLADFAESKGIDKVFFCRKALKDGESNETYKPKKIFATIPRSLVGAIAATHGKKVAESFIEKEILSANEQ